MVRDERGAKGLEEYWRPNSMFRVVKKESSRKFYSNPSTFSIRSIQHSTMSITQLPGTKFSIKENNVPTNSVYCQVNSIGTKQKTSPARRSATALLHKSALLVWLPYCSPGVVLMISESPENRIQLLFLSIF